MDGIDPQHAAHLETRKGPRRPSQDAWPDERTHAEVGDRLREVLELSTAVRHAFTRRLNLSEHELDAMAHLVAEPMGPVELSRRLGITSAAATLLLHRLTDAGHVERRPHPEDRRRKVVVPTPSGLAGVFRELRPMVEALDAAAADLDDAERAVVLRYLERVAGILRRTAEHGPEPPH